MRVGDKAVRLGEMRELEIGRVAVIAMQDDMADALFRPRKIDDMARRHALPAIVVARPLRDTVYVGRVVDLRLTHEFVPAPRERIFDLAGDGEPPVRFGNVGLDAEIEDGPVLDKTLPGRQAVDAVLAGLAGQQAAGPRPGLFRFNQLRLDFAAHDGVS